MTVRVETEKIPVGISSCLLGDRVRYDGGHKLDAFIAGTLGKVFEFRPFCPELEIGLGVPREPVRLVSDSGATRCVGTRTTQLDVTDRLVHCADAQQSRQEELCGYIFKQDSPSCGVARVKVFRNGQPERSGSGIYAARVMQNFTDLPVAEEAQLGDMDLRENFIERVFIYRRWQQLMASAPDRAAVATFHAQHELILASHDPDQARELGRFLSATTGGIDTVCHAYRHRLMLILKKVATRGNHVNVLQQLQGCLGNQLDTVNRQALVEAIEQYRAGQVSSSVPLTLLRQHIRQHPDEELAQSFYINPPQQEQQLLNLL